MRLRRIEAVRFGRLREASLENIGDGLTVVHGPNEAGKSSFTALVRHILYGYPTLREKESGYFVDGDGRLGRLLFEEDGGRWVVERAEGTHGGEVRVRTLEGQDRPRLLADVTHGVSSLAFRVVFGFGLDEMARIEELRGSEDDIISRLYAASAGLAVSPHEVRTAIEREAAEIFKQGARKRELNSIAAELRSTRAAIRELKAAAESFQSDQQRRRELEQRLDGARELRDATRANAVELALAADKAAGLRKLLGQQEESLRALRLERKQLEDERAAIALDGPLLELAPELDALLEEAGGFQAGCESLKSADANVARAESKASDAAARTGLAEEAVRAIGRDHGLAAAADEAREDLQRLQLQCESRAEEAQRVAGIAAQAEAALARALEPLGIDANEAEGEIAERLDAVEAIESLRGGSAVASHRGADVPAIIMLISGIAAIGTGIALGEWVSLGIGILLTAAGALFLLRAKAGAPVLPVTDERPYLTMLGLQGDAGTLELSRARRALEAARAGAAAAKDARARWADAERDAGLARDAYETRKALWIAWLVAHELPADATPASAAQLIVLAREACVAMDAVAEARAEAQRISAALDEFALRLGARTNGVLDTPGPVKRDDVPGLVNRLKERLASARAAAARVGEIARELQALDSRIGAETERFDEAVRELTELLDKHGLAEGEDLAVLAAKAEVTAGDAAESFDELAEEKNRLEGRLAGEAHERRGSELQLDEAGLHERLTEALDRYLVLATASQLLSDALERYERERQPEVVRSAERLFERITDGRYVGLSVPLTDSRIEVFDSRAGAKTSDILSTGAAQQLYLALRLGLIRQLGEAGRGLPVLMDDVFANFDPARKRGAAEAVAELAEDRQVIFFTCHPEVAALFSEVAPGHARIDLPRCD